MSFEPVVIIFLVMIILILIYHTVRIDKLGDRMDEIEDNIVGAIGDEFECLDCGICTPETREERGCDGGSKGEQG